MYVVRDIFQLKFGHFRDVKTLFTEAVNKGMFPESHSVRGLSDFTGDAYRFVLEQTYSSLADYEKELTTGMAKEEWQQWYMQFREHIESSHREIMKEVI
jgi:hypothetical protein